jgi:hypothetical protein
MTSQAKNDIKQKIIKGLELNYKHLIEEKRAKKQAVVVMRNNRIEYINL